MPRQPKNVTVVRQIRMVTGMKQKEFAKFIGMNRHNYQSLENGRLPWTPAVEKKILKATGALPASCFIHLGEGVIDFPVAVEEANHEYAREHWENWKRKGRPGLPNHRTSDLAAAFTTWCEVLLEAADAVTLSKLDQVYEHICNLLTEARKNFGLESETNRILAARPITNKFRLTYGQLRRSPDLAKKAKFKDKNHHPDGSIVANDDKLEVSITTYPTWSPSTNPLPKPSQPSAPVSRKRRSA